MRLGRPYHLGPHLTSASTSTRRARLGRAAQLPPARADCRLGRAPEAGRDQPARHATTPAALSLSTNSGRLGKNNDRRGEPSQDPQTDGDGDRHGASRRPMRRDETEPTHGDHVDMPCVAPSLRPHCAWSDARKGHAQSMGSARAFAGEVLVHRATLTPLNSASIRIAVRTWCMHDVLCIVYTSCTLRCMGWLADQAKDMGVASLRALAFAMRDSKRWPVSDKRSAETVANKLREVDKGDDVGWWSGTGSALIPALAEVLGEEQNDVVERLQRAARSLGDAGTALWIFQLFPALRALDLRRESPFPGIPDEIVREGGPRAERTWWVAPPGAGKTLVGRWLELRHGWVSRTAARWGDLELPREGRVFVELGSVAGITREMVGAIPKTLKICVAAPRALTIVDPTPLSHAERSAAPRPVVPLPRWSPLAQLSLPSTQGSFLQLNPLPPERWVSAVIDWATARVTPGGGFSGEGVQRLFRSQPFAGLCETPGELIGFLGMINIVGIDEIASMRNRRQRWIHAWLGAVMDRQDRSHAAGTSELLRKRGDELLVQMEVERHRRGLMPALTAHEWETLLPQSSEPQIDRLRLLDLLTSKTDNAIEQALRMLAPDAASIVAGLSTAGALASDGSDHLVTSPTWVANTLSHLAIERLVRSGPEGVGALLLFPSTAEIALGHLLDDLRADETELVAECATLADPRCPEQMAALEGAFRAIGISLLTDVAVPPALIAAVWTNQMQHVTRRFVGWPVQPILSLGSRDMWRGVTAVSAWFLAAFAISRALPGAGCVAACSALNPWTGLPDSTDERARCTEALGNVAMVFGPTDNASSRDPRQLAVYRLGGELLDRHGILRSTAGLLDIQGPDLLVELACGTKYDVSETERDQLIELRFGLAALEDACRRRHVSTEIVLAWCWLRWGTAIPPCPPIAWLGRFDVVASREDAKRMWVAAPASALTDALYDLVATSGDVWPWFSEPFWTCWLEKWSADRSRSSKSAEPFLWIPQGLALRAVREGAIDGRCREVHRVLWERMPDVLLALIDELSVESAQSLAQDGYGVVCDLTCSAPEPQAVRLLERARRWLATPLSFPGIGGWVAQWLMTVIQYRAPGWRDAYDTMMSKSPTSVTT
jgi:hypothetical protein